jgi:glycerol transport system ATP-binding protein
VARIVLDRIAHSYSATPRGPEDYALKQLDHVWDDGGAYALLGPSGCGKTTLLNIISGLIVPSEGRVLFNGTDVTEMPTAARNIAQVFQFPVIYDTMTVAENLAFPLKNRGVPGPEIDKRVAEVVRMLDLDAIKDRKARGLTADVKQKVSLGRGLVRPDVNAVLFRRAADRYRPAPQMAAARPDQGAAPPLRPHHGLCDARPNRGAVLRRQVVVMYEGAVVQIGTPADLFERPGPHFCRLFHRLARHERPAGRTAGRLRRPRRRPRGPARPSLSRHPAQARKSRSASGRNSCASALTAPACRSRSSASMTSAA